MPSAEIQTLELRLPRLLLDPGQRDLPCGDASGLLSVRLRWRDGVITAIEAIEAQADQPLAITPPVDAHVHLDKAFSWDQFPNYAGTMEGALAANWREGEQRTREQVWQRGTRALEQAWRYGLRALRSHVDSGSSCAEPSWDALLALQQQWRGRVDLQLVALAPLPFWSSAAGLGLAHRVAASGGLLGGVIGPPFADSQRDGASLRALLDLAGDLGCGIDLHLDESSEAPACGLRLLLDQLDRGHPGVPITCSHSSSLGLLKEPVARRLAARMQRHSVAVVALPTTNFWLLGRHQETQAGLRPLAPVRLLQQEGVAVAIGADNVQDPWYPGGDFDPLELLRLTYRASHTPPWQRQGLMPFTTVPSALLNLAWDGVLRSGAPADLVVTTATSWSDCLARPPQRRVLRQGQWLPAPSCESLN
ncbi:MAG: amidohydrolase family protein [Vulcanococcus sp.]